MIKIPLARAKAATASLPTLLDDGRVFLRIRLTHATGGSNSTADGGPVDDGATTLVLLLEAVGGVAEAVASPKGAGVLGVSVSFIVASPLSAVVVVVSGVDMLPDVRCVDRLSYTLDWSSKLR